MNEADPTKAAVEKMKQAAMIGTPGEPVGEDSATASSEGPEDAPRLPPHKRVIKVDDVNQELPNRQKIPAAQIARVIFKLSTGNDEDDSTLKVGEARLLLTQLTHLNQVIEDYQRATLVAETVLKDVLAGGSLQHQIVDAIAALKKARQ